MAYSDYLNSIPGYETAKSVYKKGVIPTLQAGVGEVARIGKRVAYGEQPSSAVATPPTATTSLAVKPTGGVGRFLVYRQ